MTRSLPAVFRLYKPTFFTPPNRNNTPSYRVREREKHALIVKVALPQTDCSFESSGPSKETFLELLCCKSIHSASLSPQPSLKPSSTPPIHFFQAFLPFPWIAPNGLLWFSFLFSFPFPFPSSLSRLCRLSSSHPSLLPGFLPPLYHSGNLLPRDNPLKRSRQLPPAKRRFFI